MLEPEHDLVAVEGAVERGVAGDEGTQHLVVGGPAAVGDEARPRGAQCRLVESGRDRALIKHVVPRQACAGQLRGSEAGDGRFAVGDVQHLRSA